MVFRVEDADRHADWDELVLTDSLDDAQSVRKGLAETPVTVTKTGKNSSIPRSAKR